MKARNYLIVKAGNEYNNEVELSTGHKIVVNSTIESVEHINREVEVLAAPEFTKLKKGDKVIIHHNILRRKNDIKGEEIKSQFHFKDDTYYVPLTEVFAFKRDGQWESLDPFCFIKPIPLKDKEVGGILVRKEDQEGHKGRVHRVGTVRFPNQEMKDMGLKEGDTIHFEKDSEYEFKIDGELLYRMKTSDILAQVI
jgi:co-chaperonin GroES (HSP10)